MLQLNYLTLVFFGVYLSQICLQQWLELCNRRYLLRCGNVVPPAFKGFIDQPKLAQANAYMLTNSRFRSLGHVVSDVVLLIILFSGLLPYSVQIFDAWHLSYLVSGILFFFMPGAILLLLELPFDYYHTFVIEEQFGFNRSTRTTWCANQLKSLLVSSLIFSLPLIMLLGLIVAFPNMWWLLGFTALTSFQILLLIIYPLVIAPIFNRFEPLQDQVLAAKVEELLKGAGLKMRSIMQIDASRRGGHTNAYFTGLGHSKRIVLFDTLMNTHTHDEILAILAHEIGHHRLHHIYKKPLGFVFSMLAFFYVTHLVLDWKLLYQTFGFNHYPSYVGLFLLGIFWIKAGFFLNPLFMVLSRRFERQADRYAFQLLKSNTALITVFKRLAADNLTNLTPHPLYVWFNYSHPPMLDRIAWLEQTGLRK